VPNEPFLAVGMRNYRDGYFEGLVLRVTDLATRAAVGAPKGHAPLSTH
jgi:hypothetical protein